MVPFGKIECLVCGFDPEKDYADRLGMDHEHAIVRGLKTNLSNGYCYECELERDRQRDFFEFDKTT